MIDCKRVIISGIVQGVFFRISTQQMAKKLRLTGWVKNNPNGTVEAIFCGELNQLVEMVDWCHNGPEQARVEKVEIIRESPSQQYQSFEIR